MKILFFPSGCLPFHARSLDERPLGGMETAVIRLSDALTKIGHQVFVCSGMDNPPLSDPLYLPIRSFADIGRVDVLIAVREWKPALLPIEADLRMLWTGDSYDQPQTVGIGDKRVAEKLDVLLPVSNWHLQRLCEVSGFPQEKSRVLRNGIHLEYFNGAQTRIRKRLIYSSAPYRGLAHLPKLYLEIKRRHPDAELHVFSGYNVYWGPKGYDQRAVAEFGKLAEVLKRLPGCTLHGNVVQAKLAEEYLKSAVLVYPNIFEETSCITAMESQAAGCPVVTSALGALPETVGEAGKLIDGVPGSTEYDRRFIEAVDSLLSDDDLFAKLSENAKKRSRQFAWEKIAEDFAADLKKALEMRKQSPRGALSA